MTLCVTHYNFISCLCQIFLFNCHLQCPNKAFLNLSWFEIKCTLSHCSLCPVFKKCLQQTAWNEWKSHLKTLPITFLYWTFSTYYGVEPYKNLLLYGKNLVSVAGGRSRLHLIDLGSSSKSKDPDNVSLSLSALGNVIMALLNGQRHVPHR